MDLVDTDVFLELDLRFTLDRYSQNGLLFSEILGKYGQFPYPVGTLEESTVEKRMLKQKNLDVMDRKKLVRGYLSAANLS
jgi:hypothetical protein